MSSTAFVFNGPEARERSVTAKGAARMGVLVAGALACLAHQLRGTGAIGDSTYLFVTLALPLAAGWYVRRADVPDRGAVRWLLAGLVCSGIGDLIYYALAWTDRFPPGASLADAFYIASYVVLAIGVLMLIHGTPRVGGLDLGALIDLGSFAVMAMIVVVFASGMDDVLHDDELSIVTRLVLCTYPILDAALFAVLIRALLSRTMINRRGLVLLLGLACWMVTDFANISMADTTMYTAQLDLGWMIGSVLMAASPLLSVRPAINRPPRRWADRHIAAWVAFSLCPLLAPAIVEVWGGATNREPNHLWLLLAALVLVMLAVARSIRLVHGRNENERRLRESEHFFQALAENAADAVVVVDAAGRIANEAPALAKMVGRTGTPTRGADVVDMLNPHHAQQARAALERLLVSATDHPDHSEFCIQHTDGTDRWFAFRAINRMDDPIIRGVIFNFQDVTDRRRVEAEMVHHAMHDSLTGLPNRSWFQERVEVALHRRASAHTEVAVVFLDLDGFKALNDVRGHDVGDMALRDIADRLLGCVRPVDALARLGGDEFAILVEGPRAMDTAVVTARRVLDALREPIRFDDRHVALSASIGIATSDDGSTATSMLRDADVAMYESKRIGRGTWSVYEPHMRTSIVDRMQLDIDLRTALADGQFHLVYQPIVDLATEHVVGFEALLRWRHPVRGVITPDQFIPVAEANGTIIDIGRWALDEACRVAAAWRELSTATERPRPTMSVNVSTRQLARAEFVDDVRESLQRHRLPAPALTIELTESVLVHDPLTAAHRLNDLHDLGVRLAIDDFGTGYSSLSYLRQFPVDILKIDRSFVLGITDRDQLPPIVRGLLELGRTLGLRVVAEGIDDELQRDALREQSCQFGQGFLFSKPLPEPAALQLLGSAHSPAYRRAAPDQLSPASVT